MIGCFYLLLDHNFVKYVILLFVIVKFVILNFRSHVICFQKIKKCKLKDKHKFNLFVISNKIYDLNQ